MHMKKCAVYWVHTQSLTIQPGKMFSVRLWTRGTASPFLPTSVAPVIPPASSPPCLCLSLFLFWAKYTESSLNSPQSFSLRVFEKQQDIWQLWVDVECHNDMVVPLDVLAFGNLLCFSLWNNRSLTFLWLPTLLSRKYGCVPFKRREAPPSS